MSKRTIWASNAMINPRMLRLITHSFDDGSERGQKLYSRARQENDTGHSIPAEYFPPEIFVAKDSDTNYKSLPELFFAGSYWVVAAEVVEVMRRFDMGEANFYPTRVYRKDRKTPIGKDWFCLNFGNTKTAFEPEGSKDVHPFGRGKSNRWNPPIILSDNDLRVKSLALEGPALWIDPSLREIFFVHGELRDALKEAGLARPFGFKKCKVI